MPKANCTTVTWKDADGLYFRHFDTREQAERFVETSLSVRDGIYDLAIEQRHNTAAFDPFVLWGIEI